MWGLGESVSRGQVHPYLWPLPNMTLEIPWHAFVLPLLPTLPPAWFHSTPRAVLSTGMMECGEHPSLGEGQ